MRLDVVKLVAILTVIVMSMATIEVKKPLNVSYENGMIPNIIWR